MKKLQSGFAILEGLIAIVILAGIAVAGYMVYSNHNKPTSTPLVVPSAYKSPPTAVSAVPVITKASDLIKAIDVLNQTSITSNNTDSHQLSTQVSTFQ